MESPFLDTAHAASYLGIAKSTLERWRVEGRGPIYYKIGKRCFYTIEGEGLMAFAEKQRRQSTSDSSAA